MIAIRYLTLLIMVLITMPLAAAPVTILNHGFEEPYLGGNLPPQYAGDVPATAFPVGAAPSGWEPYGAVGGSAFIGVLNPGVMTAEPLATYFPAGAPEGENIALTFFDGSAGGAEFGIEQTLLDTLQLRTRYVLTVEVGNIASGVSVVEPYASFGNYDLRGFPGYRVELLAGDAVIASDENSLLPGEGEFLTSAFDVVIGNSHDHHSELLAIRLVNLNTQDVNDPIVDLEVDFDNVRLDAAPLAPADFDGDGDVDSGDLAVWQEAYGDTVAADANGDGNSDGRDFLIWQRQSSLVINAEIAVVAVPEPAGLSLLMALAAAFSFGRSRPGR